MRAPLLGCFITLRLFAEQVTQIERRQKSRIPSEACPGFRFTQRGLRYLVKEVKLSISEEEKIYADMWMKQKDLFLRFVSFVPLIEIAILASWFALTRDGRPFAAQLLMIGGAFVMGAAWLMMWRIVQYV